MDRQAGRNDYVVVDGYAGAEGRLHSGGRLHLPVTGGGPAQTTCHTTRQGPEAPEIADRRG